MLLKHFILLTIHYSAILQLNDSCLFFEGNMKGDNDNEVL